MKSGAISTQLKQRSPDNPAGDPSPEEDKELRELEEVIKDFMQAMSAKDSKRMANIVRMAHDILHDYMDAGNRSEEEE